MIKATTPTSAGWAQAFDTSGLIVAEEERKQTRRKRFDKNVKEFDSSQVWHRDIPEFTKKVNEYYEYISDNYDALSNKSRNLDKFYEMRGMENELSNFAVASKAMGQNVDKAQKLMLDKPKLYDNPENEALIDDIITGNRYGGLSAGYESGDALNNSFMKDFNRNIIVDTDEIQERMQKYGTANIDKVKTAQIAGGKGSYQYEYDYDVEGMTAELQDMWENGYAIGSDFVSGTDLQRKYQDFEEFATVSTQGLSQYTDPKQYTEKSDKDDGGKIDYKWSVEPAPSGTGAIAQHTYTETTPATKVAGVTLKKEKTDTYTVPYVYEPASRGNVAVFGTKSIFRRRAGVSGGWNLRDNVWSETNLTDDNLSQLTNVDHGYLAESPIYFPSLTMKDEQGKSVTLKNYTAPKGAALSQEMIDAIDSGGVSYVDENGVKQPLLRDVNAGEHVWQGKVAYSRNTSYASGFDIQNPLSYMNSLTGKQYRSTAEKWENYKRDVQMHPQQISDVENNLNTYDVSDHFANPVATKSSGELDFDAMEEAAKNAAN